MSPQSDALTPAAGLASGLAGGRATCACGRTAQRDKSTCWFCDPAVPAALKLAARRRRRALALEDVDLTTAEGRQNLREAIAEAALRDELAPSLAHVALKAIEGAALEDERQQERAPEAAKRLEVQVRRFTDNWQAEP